jgi:DNA topoisomerase-1
MTNVVIVESPAKAKTINKYLGSQYRVLASYGHVRSLPKKNGSIDVENDFQPRWEIDTKSKKHIDEIVKALKSSSKLILATDPDREGEAISWHILEILKNKKALKADIAIERVVFNAITKNAILSAIESPRGIDTDLVEAYLARNSLDYLMGFNISPVLWQRLRGAAKSAGRVQSPALKLVVDREIEIEKFKKEEYWTISADFKDENNNTIQANLALVNDEKVEKFSFRDSETTNVISSALEKKEYHVTSVTSQKRNRNPFAPFTTSTLQQSASTNLKISPRDVMSTAQKLYEAGLITYMRTDGIEMAPEGISSARKEISNSLGENYLPEKPRVFKNKAKNAQEAHECIRPTDFSQTPENATKLNKSELDLYALIWRRALASQARSAEVLQTTVLISSLCKSTQFRLSGQVVTFEGHLKIFQDTKKDDDEKRIPELKEKSKMKLEKINKEQRFTEPPPRFNEASLIKRLEEEGIGRPSTYASIISKIQERNYVKKEKNRLVPEDTGRLLNFFLEAYFHKYIEYNYTAKLEKNLDDISSGEKHWKEVIRSFWEELSQSVEYAMSFSITEVLNSLNEKLADYLFDDGDGKIQKKCSLCNNGELGIKLSKTGAFIGCSSYPDCKYSRPLNANSQINPTDLMAKEEPIGQDNSGNDIFLKNGRYGPYLEVFSEVSEKPKRAAVPKHYTVDELTLEKARQLLELPRNLGLHPEDQSEVVAAIGPYGPYIKHGKVYANIKDFEEIFSIGMNRAVELLVEAAEKRNNKGGKAGKELKVLGSHPEGEEVKIMSGRYGDYIKWNKINVTIPKEKSIETLTLEESIALIDKKRKK